MLRPTRASAALLLAVVMGPVTAAENEGSDTARPAAALYDRLTDGAVRPAPPEVPSDSEAEGVVPRNPRVLFITSQGCERCARDLARLRRPGGDFEAMQSRGWKIGPEADCHLQIVDRTSIPELVAR
ncbi:MAG TPA: hypothetical protein VL475_16355, partial [Planctomycetaceae bacterium]|nr:hypothetical protein [Planctomycetaceae bacterium]